MIFGENVINQNGVVKFRHEQQTYDENILRIFCRQGKTLRTMKLYKKESFKTNSLSTSSPQNIDIILVIEFTIRSSNKNMKMSNKFQILGKLMSSFLIISSQIIPYL